MLYVPLPLPPPAYHHRGRRRHRRSAGSVAGARSTVRTPYAYKASAYSTYGVPGAASSYGLRKRCT